MRTVYRLAAALAIATLVAVGAPARADVWVDEIPGGSDLSGDGTESNPYATISFAYSQITVPGETIRVMPGLYFDVLNFEGNMIEVSPGVFVDKWVNVIADAGDPSVTTINGNFADPVIRFGGSGGTLEGFKIVGGGDSAVVALGNFSIVNNVIDGNSGDNGGGIRIESNSCLYGASVGQVIDNQIINNHSDTDGGGMYVAAGINGAGCQIGSVSVLIEGNTFSGNTSDDDGGGLEVLIDTFPAFEIASVTVRDNSFSGNTAIDDGAGLRLQAVGLGRESFVIADNTVTGNQSFGGAGAGMMVGIEATTFADHHGLVDNNIVTLNTTASDGGGIWLDLELNQLASSQSYSLVASNNLITDNTATGTSHGGGGVLARYNSEQTTIGQSDLAEFKLVANTIRNNDTSLKGGGLAAYVLTNRTGGSSCLISGLPATAQLDVESNLIVQNTAVAAGGFGGGTLLSSESCLNSWSRINFLLNTVSRNDTDTEGSGIHAEFISDAAGQPQLNVSHSIIWDNDGGAGIGGTVPTAQNWTIDVDHSNVDNNSPDYESWVGNRTGTDGNISTDPDFVNNNSDWHLEPSSPAIEAGSRALGSAPPIDFEHHPRVVDRDGDGQFIADMGADEFFLCNDSDGDGFGFPVDAGDHCAPDNCGSDYNPGQSDCDLDSTGDVCDVDTVDADGDGVDVGCDIDDGDRSVCHDLDNDGCDDCASGVAWLTNDGVDFDNDGLCNTGDPDDDADGAVDFIDDFPLNPFACGDADNDGCGDDCPNGFYEPNNDGPDFDGDGQCDVGDPDDDNDGIDDGADSDPFNNFVCTDSDLDGCDDCSSGSFDPWNDGTDADGDGRCSAGDSNDLDPNVCVDDDLDGCDDCSSGIYDVANDGLDTDLDGLCDLGDPDDDNDLVEDGLDCAPLVTGVSAPVGDLGPTLRLGPFNSTLSWQDISNSHVFNVYLGSGGANPYNHVCILAEQPGIVATEASVPIHPYEILYYLVSGKNSCGEGSLGTDSAGSPRPNGDPCPTLNVDTDQDGVLDIDDNCVLTPNPLQTDTDGDTAGDACDNCVNDANIAQIDTDRDFIGDACDSCTDSDDDGVGDPGIPGSCGTDNCPMTYNPGQFDGDGDGLGNPCDPCPSDPGNDTDNDGICFAIDNCPNAGNPAQEDLDGDGVGDPCDPCTDADGDGFGNLGFPANQCGLDNCPDIANPSQDDADGDFKGDVCDACTDIDIDGFGDPGFPANTCPEDNCPAQPNNDQQDTDADGDGDVCDACFANPAPACSCPPDSDLDGDGICQPEVIYVGEGSAIDYRSNSSDPGIPGVTWTTENYVVDGSWQAGDYGIGYETEGTIPNAAALISTSVPPGTMSIYTRAIFNVTDPGEGVRALLGLDYDDGAIAWLNGVELHRTPEMAAGDPAWNQGTNPSHESSNAANPVFEPLIDVTSTVQAELQAGTNVLAVGVWNNNGSSSDLVLVPQLSILSAIDNCPEAANIGQEDIDGDGVGDACDPCTDTDGDGFGDPGFPANTCPEDNCPNDPNPLQEDFDADNIGDICDLCPTDPTDDDVDLDGICTVDDNCPDDANPGQEDDDSDLVGNVCDNCPADPNSTQDDADADSEGDVCDLCTDTDGDGFGNPGFPVNTCPEDNCPVDSNAGQEDVDADLLGDVCDPCFQNPDLGCVECPNPEFTDPDGDGVCEDETVLLEEGTSTNYLDNVSDPGIPGIDWVGEFYVIDFNWSTGPFGLGYDTSGAANDLITTPVPVGTRSIYTRTSFEIADVNELLTVFMGADWDDGYVLWINGAEIYRSPQMPVAGEPAWDEPLLSQKEPSNAADPVYTPLNDVTTAALNALHDGTNVAAIGVWNVSSGSSDLVLVPRLSIRTSIDNCPDDPNPGQEDGDGDGIGDACDPTP